MHNNRTQKGVKQAVIAFAALLYIVGVVYGDIMFLSIVSKVFPNGLLGTLAMVGAFIAGGTAIALPIALHWWHAQGIQQIAGYLFYVADLAMLALNAILAYHLIQGQHLDSFFTAWLGICPATPLICAAGWGILFALDPSHKSRHAQENLNADLNEHYAQGLANAAQSPDVQRIIHQGAAMHAHRQVQQLLGLAIPYQGPQPQLPQLSTNVQPGQMPQTDQWPLGVALPPDAQQVQYDQYLKGIVANAQAQPLADGDDALEIARNIQQAVERNIISADDARPLFRALRSYTGKVQAVPLASQASVTFNPDALKKNQQNGNK